MNSYKVRGKEKPRTILLPLSFGVSSITLLHVLDQQLRTQLERTSRTGYKIHVVFVTQYSTSRMLEYDQSLNLVKQRYPLHTYSFISLESIFDYNLAFDDILNTYIAPVAIDTGMTRADQLSSLISSLSSTTSIVDILALLRTRLIVAFAQDQGCDAVVWGDTTTRLAEKTLSETAKGRGTSLPWITADGTSLYQIRFAYPLRDLLKKEVAAHAEMTTPTLRPLIVEDLKSEKPTSSKDQTIDGLMAQYFESVENNYPSIVTNVVRTASRLDRPGLPTNGYRCGICSVPVAAISTGLLAGSGNHQGSLEAPVLAKPRSQSSDFLCYGCQRSLPHP